MSIDIIKGGSGQTLVKNSELVLNAFGYWPAFHDAEVVTFSISMTAQSCGKSSNGSVASIRVTLLTAPSSRRINRLRTPCNC